MDLLKNRILKDGIALNEYVLKVDSFLNHQVDANLMQQINATLCIGLLHFYYIICISIL